MFIVWIILCFLLIILFLLLVLLTLPWFIVCVSLFGASGPLNIHHDHLSIYCILNLLSYLGLVEVARVDTLHLRKRWHELIEFVVAVGLYLFQEVIHLQCLAVAWDLVCGQDVRVVLQASTASCGQAHILLLLLKGVLLARDDLSLLSVAANGGVACISKLRLITKGCVACNLTFEQAS